MPPYIKLGFEHILDLEGYDHILFVSVLCAAFSVKDWKKIVLLATAFTLGHSLTLALSSLKIVNVNAQLVEIGIAVTILLSALYNFYAERKGHLSMSIHYVLASTFGLIHGLGFSNFFKAMMSEESIIMPLLEFNIGVELGQILVILAYLAIVFILKNGLGVCQKYINYFISAIGALEAIRMIIDRI